MYENRTKAEARQWAWNRICNNFKAKYIKRQTTVACLIGDTLNELETGIKKGFLPNNIIGVDRRAESVQMWQNAGGTAYKGEFIDALSAMPKKPDACILDYCNGLNLDNINTFAKCMAFGKVIIANFLRGRDKVSQFRHPGMEHITHRGHLFFDDFARCFQMEIGGSLEHSKQLLQAMKPEFYSYKSEDSNQYFDMVKLEMPQNK